MAGLGPDRPVDPPAAVESLDRHVNAPAPRRTVELDRFAYVSDAVFAIALDRIPRSRKHEPPPS